VDETDYVRMKLMEDIKVRLNDDVLDVRISSMGLYDLDSIALGVYKEPRDHLALNVSRKRNKKDKWKRVFVMMSAETDCHEIIVQEVGKTNFLGKKVFDLYNPDFKLEDVVSEIEKKASERDPTRNYKGLCVHPVIERYHLKENSWPPKLK
jgi:hypothetical protein